MAQWVKCLPIKLENPSLDLHHSRKKSEDHWGLLAISLGEKLDSEPRIQ